jgi:hypothetical protein
LLLCCSATATAPRAASTCSAQHRRATTRKERSKRGISFFFSFSFFVLPAAVLDLWRAGLLPCGGGGRRGSVRICGRPAPPRGFSKSVGPLHA